MKTDINIIGISAFYHDSAVALLRNGEIAFAAQEERYTRVKADPDFPMNALKDCLFRNNLSLSDIDYIIFYENPAKKYKRIIEDCANGLPQSINTFVRGAATWLAGKNNQLPIIESKLRRGLNIPAVSELPPIYCTDHHLSHAASAFYPSPFDEAAVLCVDGIGEFESTSMWHGRSNKITKISGVEYPHSLGLLYSAFTQYTGFAVNSGEYKLMGLAPYGKPIYKELILDKIIHVSPNGKFKLNLKYFAYRFGNKMINRKFERLFGEPARKPEESVRQIDMDVAASIQSVFDDLLLNLVNSIYEKLPLKNLCIAGGVGLNCVANGHIKKEGPFENVWVQPAAGDAGGALGAALVLWHELLDSPRLADGAQDNMYGAYLGPDYSDSEISDYLDSVNAAYKFYDEKEMIKKIAHLLSESNVVGWFQGKMEFGPRSLGNRSILGDPRSCDMQSVMNLKIKFRESFRPFAPAVLAEKASSVFELDYDSPYMLFVANVNEEHRILFKRDENKNLTGIELLKVPKSNIPAITHINYSARIQTVHQNTNYKFHSLLSEFDDITGCPVLVNTSFNVRGEPIVCSPQDAYECFMNTEMDYLVVGNHVLSKVKQPESNKIKKYFKPD